MKLLDRYNRISLLTTILVIVVTGVVYYFTISYILTRQIDKDLLVEENEIFDYVKLNHRLPQVFKSEDLKIQFTPIGKRKIVRSFIDTEFWDAKEQDSEAARGLQTWVKVNNENYAITILESKVETEDLIRLIFMITLGIILLLIVILMTINRLLLRNLWKPFYAMLRQIKLFNLADQTRISTLATRIDEFDDMNQEIAAMSERVIQDYQELKSFVENAAHELMTPVAVLKFKLDSLLQNIQLDEQQANLIGDMYSTIGKLTRLNKAMLLLTKIENKLINEQDTINLKEAIENSCSELADMLGEKILKLHLDLSSVTIVMSKTLLDILLNNLLGNAIRHNHPGGVIIVKLTENTLTIQNSGRFDALNPVTIFQRFHKSPESEGSGLGLTLAREISENYGFNLQYSFEGNLHTFRLNLKKPLT
jgi:signal transduction histidine kinase